MFYNSNNTAFHRHFCPDKTAAFVLPLHSFYVNTYNFPVNKYFLIYYLTWVDFCPDFFLFFFDFILISRGRELINLFMLLQTQFLLITVFFDIILQNAARVLCVQIVSPEIETIGRIIKTPLQHRKSVSTVPQMETAWMQNSSNLWVLTTLYFTLRHSLAQHNNLYLYFQRKVSTFKSLGALWNNLDKPEFS